MDALLFWKGLLIGLAVSIPLGPMGVLCVTRTLNHGRYSGFFSGLGAATADTIFALVAGFGLTYIINFIKQQELILQLFGGLLIIVIGWRLFFANPIKRIREKRISRNRLVQDFLSVLLFTLSNPMAIFLFLAIFTASNVVLDKSTPLQNFVLFFGVFSGASLWWFALSSLVYSFRARVRLRRLVWVNRITGGFLLIAGLVALLHLFIPF